MTEPSFSSPLVVSGSVVEPSLSCDRSLASTLVDVERVEVDSRNPRSETEGVGGRNLLMGNSRIGCPYEIS